MYTQQSHFYAFLMNVKMHVPHKNMDTKVCDIQSREPEDRIHVHGQLNGHSM